MSGTKRERWTESDVLALPAGEHDYFDRKSGALSSTPDFRKDIAKALCAFANSGGGHLVLGLNDAGMFDGVPPTRGNTPTRDNDLGVFVAASLTFRVQNVGRVAAYKWAIVVEGFMGGAVAREADYRFHRSTFPAGAASLGSGGISLDETILPSLSAIVKREFGFQLRATRPDRVALLADTHAAIPPNFQICYRLVTETSRGEHKSTHVATLPGFGRFVQSLTV